MPSILVTVLAAATSATAQIAATSWGQNRIDVFGTTDADVWHKYYTQQGGWAPSPGFESLGQAGENIIGQPTSISWGEGRVDFFAVSEDFTAYHKFWDGSNWNPKGLEVLGGKHAANIYSDLSAAAWGPKRLDVVGLGENGTYLHLYYDGHQWNGWEDLGHPAVNLNFSAPPSIVSWGKDRFDVFGIAENGSAFHKFWAGDHYEPASGWELLGWQEPEGGFLVSAVTSTSWGANRLDLWATGADGELYHTLWDHNYYGPWESLGGNFGGDFAAAPSVTHWASNRIDIVGQDQDAGEYLYKFWDGYGWRPSAEGWYPKGKFEGPPSTVSWGANNLNIFGINRKGKLVWQAWNQSYWIPSADEFIELGDIANPLGDSKELRKAAGQVILNDLKIDI